MYGPNIKLIKKIPDEDRKDVEFFISSILSYIGSMSVTNMENNIRAIIYSDEKCGGVNYKAMKFMKTVINDLSTAFEAAKVEEVATVDIVTAEPVASSSLNNQNNGKSGSIPQTNLNLNSAPYTYDMVINLPQKMHNEDLKDVKRFSSYVIDYLGAMSVEKKMDNIIREIIYSDGKSGRVNEEMMKIIETTINNLTTALEEAKIATNSVSADSVVSSSHDNQNDATMNDGIYVAQLAQRDAISTQSQSI